MTTIYQCIKRDERYTPPQTNIVHYAETEKEAMDWLEENGGGIYRNVLHNFDCKINGKGDKQ